MPGYGATSSYAWPKPTAAAVEQKNLSLHLLCSCCVTSGECEATGWVRAAHRTHGLYLWGVFFTAEEAVEVGRQWCEPLAEIASNEVVWIMPIENLHCCFPHRFHQNKGWSRVAERKLVGLAVPSWVSPTCTCKVVFPSWLQSTTLALRNTIGKSMVGFCSQLRCLCCE